MCRLDQSRTGFIQENRKCLTMRSTRTRLVCHALRIAKAAPAFGVPVSAVVRHQMEPPDSILEDADVVAFAAVPASAVFTGRLHLFADGVRIGRVPNLAICQPHNERGLFLLHCDESWDMVAIQTWNGPGVERIMTIEAMKIEAERYYEGLMPSWRIVANGDA